MFFLFPANPPLRPCFLFTAQRSSLGLLPGARAKAYQYAILLAALDCGQELAGEPPVKKPRRWEHCGPSSVGVMEKFGLLRGGPEASFFPQKVLNWLQAQEAIFSHLWAGSIASACSGRTHPHPSLPRPHSCHRLHGIHCMLIFRSKWLT